MRTTLDGATLVQKLAQVDGKAEIVDGEIIKMSPTEGLPGRAGGKIYASLVQVEAEAGGFAYPDNVGFLTEIEGRQSFSPDAAFSTERPTMSFATRAPEFAAEVRSDGDYGPTADREIAEKRDEYFAAGTKVVWDVDLMREEVVHVYRADKPTEPIRYRRGDMAEAGPAVPGWKMPVDDLFD